MITLRDSIDISAPLDTLYEWLRSLDENFVKWSPYHEYFNWLLFDVIAKKRADWQLIQNDMAEDNRFLKQILETGEYPRGL